MMEESPRVRPPTRRPISILFIGNSFTYGDGGEQTVALGSVPGLVKAIAAAAGSPLPRTRMCAPGGWSLRKHVEDAKTTLPAIDRGHSGEPWDYVVLQEFSTRPTDARGEHAHGDPEGFKADATALYDRVKQHNPDATVVLYETWPRHPDYRVKSAAGGEEIPFYPACFPSYAEMQAQLRRHILDAAERYIPAHSAAERKSDLLYAPVGDAWEESLQIRPDLRLHGRDSHHGGDAGYYLAALVLVHTIYGMATIGLPPLMDLTADDADHLETVADTICARYLR